MPAVAFVPALKIGQIARVVRIDGDEAVAPWSGASTDGSGIAFPVCEEGGCYVGVLWMVLTQLFKIIVKLGVGAG